MKEVAQTVKCLPAMQETWVRFLGWEDPLEKEMAIHSSTLPGKSHGWRSLIGYSSWGRKESDRTEWLHFHFQEHGETRQAAILAIQWKVIVVQTRVVLVQKEKWLRILRLLGCKTQWLGDWLWQWERMERRTVFRVDTDARHRWKLWRGVDLGRDVTLLMLALVNLRWAWDIQAEMLRGKWMCECASQRKALILRYKVRSHVHILGN